MSQNKMEDWPCFWGKNKNGKNIANPIDEDNIIGNAKQIKLTNMRASAVEL